MNQLKYGRLKVKDSNKALVAALKEGPCLDCHYLYDPCQMDFDHRQPNNKFKGIGQLIGGKREILLKELKKCDLVCSNCHRLRTKRRLELEKEFRENIPTAVSH